MAATDKLYRSQKALDIVFGVSSILLLATTFWMLYDDHARPFKPVQRTFRDVEEGVVSRAMLDKLPDAAAITTLDQTWGELRDARKKLQDEQAKIADQERQLLVEKANYDAKAQSLKADSDSLISLINIAVDQRDNAHDTIQHDELTKIAADLQKQRDSSLEQQATLNTNSEAVARKLDELRAPVKAKDAELAREIYAKLKERNFKLPREETVDSLSQLEDAVKKMTADLDRLAKVAAQRRWKFGDWFRSWPVIDGFASPFRIDQITLNDLTIPYGSFRDVPRYDRCTTCHLGIDRANYDPQTLAKLADASDDLKKKHEEAVKFLRKRADQGEDLGFNPGDLGSSLPIVKLTPGQIKQYSAHPRLDLFVDANSPHAAERFGCTICHNGQGSATDFVHAAHSPNDPVQRRNWVQDHSWEHSEFWDFPMHPERFVESGCVKCHHQMTDLIRYGNKEEAPKLLKGYNLVREFGCFGCHEISGLKAGKQVGPDLRLEPWPALDTLTPEEQVRAHSDPLNPPGTQRKVGPSLRRLSEKTSEQWTRKWIQSPRSFRPDTRMPHFYGLTNNTQDVLPEDQKKIPDAEIHSISHYLMTASEKYLKGTDEYRVNNEKRLQELLTLQKNNTISDKERKELGEVQRRLDQYPRPIPLKDRLIDGEGRTVTLPEATKDLAKGRTLFSERGCLACHQHEGTTKGGNNVASEAQFGPNLSALAAKIGVDGQSPAEGRRWLVQWILNPNVHFSRTRMPITHLNVEEAAAVADWLLSQKIEPTQQWVDTKDVPEPSSETLVDLAKIYLRKAPRINPLDIDSYFEKTGDGFKGIPANKQLDLGADEEVLRGGASVGTLKYYIGRKTISRMGCFACHDIPGFETAKPIGTPLNDWGKKDAERLAFEDADAFVKSNLNVVELRNDPKDSSKPAPGWGAKDGKRPIERFFADALDHHKREGFLHLKLMEPRSYDYHRDIRWDDRLRMPQFKFAHTKKNEDEDDAAFAARAEKEEAESREAVMTFILGLVAEPVHPRYLNAPGPDRMAEVKGRKVLEKFNCYGCHQVRPGVYDFNLTEANRKALQTAFDAAKSQSKSDFFFDMHNAWAASQAPATDRMRVFASNPSLSKDDETGEDVLTARLSQATSYIDEDGKPRNIPAGINLTLPTKGLQTNDQFGGTFSNLMQPYLAKKNPLIYKLTNGESAVARKDLPPTLVREGERVQPDWLFTFLKNPTQIRPQVILRMPKFNMSDEDAQALVNYFAGVDRSGNPGIGLIYPYLRVLEREESYWNSRNHEYVARLAKANQLEARADKFVKDSDKLLAVATEADKSAIEADVKAVKEALAKKDSGSLQKALVDANLYWFDAYRLLTTPAPPEDKTKPDDKPKTTQSSACLQCHRIGAVKASEEQGPPLELAQGRLRPDWMERWMANPNRLLTYPSHMPQNFLNDSLNYQELFPGSSLEQIQAGRDVLSNHTRVADLPVNRSYRKATATGGK
jgi:cbb3-type cytochrome oxidase cytochrome c subunit